MLYLLALLRTLMLCTDLAQCIRLVVHVHVYFSITQVWSIAMHFGDFELSILTAQNHLNAAVNLNAQRLRYEAVQASQSVRDCNMGAPV